MADVKAIGIGMIGCGTVGGGVAQLLRDHGERYRKLLGRPVELRRVLVRDAGKARDVRGLHGDCVTVDAEAFFQTPDVSIIVEVAGGIEAAGGYVRRALESGRSVVTANKSLLAARGPELFKLAREKGVSIAFEASCGGGIPIVTAMCFGLMANQFSVIYGILNGTCNYILTEMSRFGRPYGEALEDAQRRGYAEADPTLDVSGRDAAEKLAILASLAFGVAARGEQVWSEGIEGLDTADIRFGAELDYEMKLLAIGERSGNGSVSLRVHPSFVHHDEALAQVSGTFNAVSVYGDAIGHTMYYGRGAGRAPTASAVVSDLLNVASGWYGRAFSGLRIWSDGAEAPMLTPREALTSRYYLRFNAKDVPGVLGKMTAILGARGISISAVLQHEFNEGQFVPVVLVTHRAKQGAIDRALEEVARLDAIQGVPVRVRIVDMPGG